MIQRNKFIGVAALWQGTLFVYESEIDLFEGLGGPGGCADLRPLNKLSVLQALKVQPRGCTFEGRTPSRVHSHVFVG